MSRFLRQVPFRSSKLALLALGLLPAGAARPAAITQQPAHVTVTSGQSASFTVAATGTGAVSYQWRRNGVDLPGANAATLAFNPAERANADWYEVAVTDTAGTVVSAPARLQVAPLRYPGLLAHHPPVNLLVEQTASPWITRLAEAPGGKFFAGGTLSSVDGTPRSRVARFNADGSLDAAFMPPAIIDGRVDAIVPLPDGAVVVGGTFAAVGSVARAGLARLEADGSLDASFNPVVSFRVRALAVQPDGKVLAGGVDGFVGALIRLETDGRVDAGFSAQFQGGLIGLGELVVLPDGRILVAGNFTSTGGHPSSGVCRLLPDGRPDVSFKVQVENGYVYALHALADGKVLIGGSFDRINGQVAMRFARLDANGAFDPTMPAGTGGQVEAIGVQPDGKIVVAGDFSNFSGKVTRMVARIHPDGTLDGTFNPQAPPFEPKYGIVEMVHAVLTRSDGSVIIGGTFRSFSGQPRHGLARLGPDGADVAAFAPSLRYAGEVLALVHLPGRKLFAAGNFSHIGGAAVAVPNIARLHDDATVDASFQPAAGPNGLVRGAVVQPDGGVVLVGDFSHIGDTPRAIVARLRSDGALDTGFDAHVGHERLGVSGGRDRPVILAGGRIALATGLPTWAGDPAYGLVVMHPNGTRDTNYAIGNGTGPGSAQVEVLCPLPDGKLVVGGSFTTFNGQGRNRLVRLNRDGTIDAGFDVGTGPNSDVSDVVALVDGRLLAAGYFNSFSGQFRRGVVRLGADGKLDTAYSSVIATTQATLLLPQEDGRLIVRCEPPPFRRLNENGGLDFSLSFAGPWKNEQSFQPPWAITDHGGFLLALPDYGLVRLLPGLPAGIVRHPSSQDAVAGADVMLTVEALGMPFPTYQWYRDGTALAGATQATLVLRKVTLADAGSYTVRIDNGLGRATSLAAVLNVVAAAPVIADLPRSVTIAPGERVTLTVTASGVGQLSYQWLKDGRPIAGATGAALQIDPAVFDVAGNYSVRVADSRGVATSSPLVVAVALAGKLAGAGTEVGPNIVHPNGNIYDQVLLQGASASVRADAGQVVRLSFTDLSDDIVQVEFAGAGTLTVNLESVRGPMAPSAYNQAVQYMRGHARIIVAGADETTNLAVFSVGKMTAFDPTGAFDPTKPVSATNDPARNGNPVFKAGGGYDGFADLASISILSTNGKFGGLRTSNTSYFATAGLTGVYAPGVQFTGPVFLGDVHAADTAQPVILLGSAADVRITGGDLKQSNNAAVAISGLTQLKFVAGVDSHGRALPAQANQARLEQDGVDVTATVVVNPGN